jgi:hypothetical protein
MGLRRWAQRSGVKWSRSWQYRAVYFSQLTIIGQNTTNIHFELWCLTDEEAWEPRLSDMASEIENKLNPRESKKITTIVVAHQYCKWRLLLARFFRRVLLVQARHTSWAIRRGEMRGGVSPFPGAEMQNVGKREYKSKPRKIRTVPLVFWYNSSSVRSKYYLKYH